MSRTLDLGAAHGAREKDMSHQHAKTPHRTSSILQANQAALMRTRAHDLTEFRKKDLIATVRITDRRGATKETHKNVIPAEMLRTTDPPFAVTTATGNRIGATAKGGKLHTEMTATTPEETVAAPPNRATGTTQGNVRFHEETTQGNGRPHLSEADGNLPQMLERRCHHPACELCSLSIETRTVVSRLESVVTAAAA